MAIPDNWSAVLADLPRWMSSGGAEDDVVLLSRMSLNRNAEEFLFPQRMDSSSLLPLLSGCDEAVRKMYTQSRSYELGASDAHSMALLREELCLPDPWAPSRPGQRLYRDQSGDRAFFVNGEDHFSLLSFMPGFQPNEQYGQLEQMDDILEQRFSYAVSMDLGYLRSRIDRVGNGIEADILLHLPALSRFGNFSEVLAHAQREGMQLSSFGSQGDSSLGQVYQLSCRGVLGDNEAETLEKLALVVVEFIHYEREARKSLEESGTLEFVDVLWRDYAVLRHSRLLGLRESFELLSRLSLGQSLGILPGDRAVSRALFFLTQPAHIRLVSGSEGEGDESKQTVDEFARQRADIFRLGLSS